MKNVLSIETIEDLKFGDILTLRNGERYLYTDGYLCGESHNYYCDCDCVEECYNKDLTHEDDKDFDIVEVKRPIGTYTVFERSTEPVEMTIAEISEKLGYEVKVVKEK